MRELALALTLLFAGACTAAPGTKPGATVAATGQATATDPGPIAVPVADDDPQLGVEDAPVTLVMWSDASCAYCTKHYPTWVSLVAKYREKIRIVWKDGAYDVRGREEAI